jgi:hypothetical protein
MICTVMSGSGCGIGMENIHHLLLLIQRDLVLARTAWIVVAVGGTSPCSVALLIGMGPSPDSRYANLGFRLALSAGQ